MNQIRDKTRLEMYHFQITAPSRYLYGVHGQRRHDVTRPMMRPDDCVTGVVGSDRRCVDRRRK